MYTTPMQKQEPWRRLLLRTEETATRYEAAQEAKAGGGCRLCSDSETIREFNHWRLTPNAFPYDRFFETSHMLVTKRHTDENGLNEDEKEEYKILKNTELTDTYDLVFENLPKQKSIPHHIHYHLATIRKSE